MQWPLDKGILGSHWPSHTTLDAGPGVVGFWRKALCPFSACTECAPPPVGVRERDRHVTVLCAPCWAEQGTRGSSHTGSQPRPGPSRLVPSVVGLSLAPHRSLSTLYFAALCLATAARLPPRGSGAGPPVRGCTIEPHVESYQEVHQNNSAPVRLA